MVTCESSGDCHGDDAKTVGTDTNVAGTEQKVVPDDTFLVVNEAIVVGTVMCITQK